MVFSRSFCIGDIILLHWFQKINCNFHARQNTLEISIVILCAKYNISTVSPHFNSHSALSTSHFTFHTLHSTLYTPHFYTPHSNYTPHFTLHPLHFTLHTLHFTLHTSNSTLYTVHSTLCRTLHPTSPCKLSKNAGINNFIVINLEMLTLFLKTYL